MGVIQEKGVSWFLGFFVSWCVTGIYVCQLCQTDRTYENAPTCERPAECPYIHRDLPNGRPFSCSTKTNFYATGFSLYQFEFSDVGSRHAIDSVSIFCHRVQAFTSPSLVFALPSLEFATSPTLSISVNEWYIPNVYFVLINKMHWL